MPRSRVLAGQADGRCVGEQAAEGQGLRLRPVDPALVAERVAPALERLLELRVHGEALRRLEQTVVQLAQDVRWDCRVDLGIGSAADSPFLATRAGAERRLQLFVDASQTGLHLLDEAIRLLAR